MKDESLPTNPFPRPESNSLITISEDKLTSTIESMKLSSSKNNIEANIYADSMNPNNDINIETLNVLVAPSVSNNLDLATIKKKVSFAPMVRCTLVPTAQEIYACGAGTNIWWSADDYKSFKQSAFIELKELMSLYPWSSEKEILKLYCKILNLQIQDIKISFLPSTEDDIDNINMYSPQSIIEIYEQGNIDGRKSSSPSNEELYQMMNSYDNLDNSSHSVNYLDSFLQVAYNDDSQKGLLPWLGNAITDLVKKFTA